MSEQEYNSLVSIMGELKGEVKSLNGQLKAHTRILEKTADKHVELVTRIVKNEGSLREGRHRMDEIEADMEENCKEMRNALGKKIDKAQIFWFIIGAVAVTNGGLAAVKLFLGI